MTKLNDQLTIDLTHDINSTLSALMSALELMNEEWRTNPELVDKILPLTSQKFDLLKEQLILYRNPKN